MLCDFEKAFDSVSHDFILKTLKKINFGPNICNWITTLYRDAFANIQVNVFLSDTINIQRGCRQGNPLSPYSFILSAEIVSIKIKNNKNIKGITIDNIEYKLSQFADDTSL